MSCWYINTYMQTKLKIPGPWVKVLTSKRASKREVKDYLDLNNISIEWGNFLYKPNHWYFNS